MYSARQSERELIKYSTNSQNKASSKKYCSKTKRRQHCTVQNIHFLKIQIISSPWKIRYSNTVSKYTYKKCIQIPQKKLTDVKRNWNCWKKGGSNTALYEYK